MKNVDLLKIKQSWDKLGGLTGFTFLMELRRNKRLIDNKIEELEFVREETPDYKKFRDEYLEARKEYADRDSNDRPVMTQMQGNPSAQTYLITKRLEEWAVKEKELVDKYKTTLDIMDQKNIDYNDALEQECNIDFYVVSEKEVPKNINNEQLDLIEFMIELDEDEVEKHQLKKLPKKTSKSKK